MEGEGFTGLGLEREVGGEERTKGRETKGIGKEGRGGVRTRFEMEGEGFIGLDLEMEGEGVLCLGLEIEVGGEERTIGRETEGVETAGRDGAWTRTETEREVFKGLDLAMEGEEVLGLGLERTVRGEERTKGRETEGIETAGREKVGTGTKMEGEGVIGLGLERERGAEEGKGRGMEGVETGGRGVGTGVEGGEYSLELELLEMLREEELLSEEVRIERVLLRLLL